MAGIKQWLGIGGSSDGTPTGTFSMWKVVSGVGSVVAATSDAILTTINTAVQKLATEVTVGDGLAVRQATASKLNATVVQGTAASLKCEPTQTDAAKLVTTARQATAADLNCTEASALDTKIAVQLIDDAVVAQDGVAGKGMTVGVELKDIAAMPADGVAGTIRRVLGSLKGILYTYEAYLGFAEDASRNVMRVERQGAETGRLVASGVVVAAGTGGRILGHVLEAGAGGATFNVRKDGVIGGAIIAQFVLAASTYRMEDWPDWPYGNGLYCEIVAGGGAFNFVVRNT